MTINQILHHAEQMEAMREEFQKFWNGNVSHHLNSTNIDKKHYGWIEHYCWTAWRSAKGVKI